MKSSWMIGVMMIWLMIFAAEQLISANSIFSPTTYLAPMVDTTIASGSNVTSTLYTIVSNLGIWIKTIAQALFLYEPSVFGGSYIWLWYFICLPIDIGLWFSIVMAMRGTHSS